MSPISVRWQQSFGDYTWNNFVPYIGAWVQDNWQIGDKVTLNLGLRWDYAHNWAGDQWEVFQLRSTTPQDFTNFGPRLGFAYQVGDMTVIRGGWGRYHIGPKDQWSHHIPATRNIAIPSAENPGGITGDGRAGFAVDPFNAGAVTPIGTPRAGSPTVEEAFSTLSRRDTSGYIVDESAFVPYSNQTSLGLQQQIGQTMSFQADFVWTDAQGEQFNWNHNVTYNPETGVNFPLRAYSDPSVLRYPAWGVATRTFSAGNSDYRALETGFTKRFADRWQASATYTFSQFDDFYPSPVFGAFPIAPDLGDEFGPAAGEQDHRAVFNVNWEAPGDIQTSALYFYGSGQRVATRYGGDLRDSGGKSRRLRPDGTIMARNDFVGLPIHRLDLRFVRPIQLGPIRLEGSLELFNVFNHDNFAVYGTTESSPTFGRPVQTFLTAYVPRTMAVGFAVDF